MDTVLTVHGGLTFSSFCNKEGPLSTSVCHVPELGEPEDVWWFGFDCAHSGDKSPGTDVALRKAGVPSYPGETYKNMEYVREQTAFLAEQLRDYALRVRPKQLPSP